MNGDSKIRESTVTISDILDAVNANLPHLQDGQSYTLQQLVGDALWLSTPEGQRKRLGAEFKPLAVQGDLPVSWADRNLSNKQLYQLK